MSDERRKPDGDGGPELPPLPSLSKPAAESPGEPEPPPRTEFHLAVLDCPTCAAPLDAESADVAFYCTACRNGYRLERAAEASAPTRLAPVDVAFIAAPNVAAERWVPFWLLPAEVRLERRTGSGRKHQFRDFALVAKLFPQELRPRRDGSVEMTFAVPAFATAIASLQRLIYEYTYRGTGRGERIGERLTGGTFGPRDAEKLAHYAFITAEIRKPDTLTDLSYRIDFGEPRLLGVPAVRHGDGWRDGLYGVPF